MCVFVSPSPCHQSVCEAAKIKKNACQTKHKKRKSDSIVLCGYKMQFYYKCNKMCNVSEVFAIFNKQKKT